MENTTAIKNYRAKDLRERTAYRNSPVNVLIVGATGAGKSSAVNALIGKNVVKAGTGTDPETMTVTPHCFNRYLTLWDSPGLGDGMASDKRHSALITKTLKMRRKNKTTGRTYGVIDMVLVVIEGSVRDMGTTYRLLNDVIIPNFPTNRIIVAVNQADIAMKGTHWNTAKPDKVLNDFLSDKSKSVRSRIEDSTGIKVRMPVCFSAEYQWNLKGLMNLIIDSIPKKYR